MNYNKIPTIILNNQYTNVINRERILEYLKLESDISKIEKYVEHNALVLKNNPHLKIKDVVDIMEYSNYRINKLKGNDKVVDVFNETKKEVNNLSNIEIIYTPYFMNDKNKNGFRYDVTYVKIKDELYELRNVEKVMNFIGNKEIIKDLSEYEVVKFIKENSDLIKTNNLDNKGEITTELVEEEIEKESDKKIRDALLAHKNDVVKEREKLQEYINNNMPDVIIKYGVNSNEERIYTVGDKMIKFEGPDRVLQILSQEEIDKLMTGKFEKKEGYQKEIENNEYNEITDFLGKEEILYEIVEKLYREEELTNEEIILLTSFLTLYIDSKEQNIEVDENLDYVAEKWFENTSVDRKYPNEELEKIYERIRKYRKNKVKIYEMEELNNKAFISLFAVLESTLILGLIAALIMLFK